MPTDLALPLPAAAARQQQPDVVARCALRTLAARLPLPWPTPPDTPPSPKPRSRSAYQSPDPTALLALDAVGWQALSPFDLILRLIDFSGLRPVLAAQLYATSARGRAPFDPVSLFLLFGWQLVNRWSRTDTLRHLAEPRYADYAQAFGFQPGVYPSESGFRYFLTTLGADNLTPLLVQSMLLVRDAGLLPPAVQQAATVSFDGMLHDAASRLRCSAVQASCYTPTTPDQPRPCPAQAKGQRGCSCQIIACQTVCQHATPRDPDARFVWYTGSNHTRHPNASAAVPPPATPAPTPGAAPPKPPHGEGHYGYRSLPVQLIDPIQRVSWTLAAADLAPAPTREEEPAAQLLERVVAEYAWLRPAFAVGDAGLGYAAFLGKAADLGIRRLVDLRTAPADDDPAEWRLRGYDDQGWPVCTLGYRLHPNGYDAERRRNKWCCRQRCETAPPAGPHPLDPPTAAPDPPDCPYRDRTAHPDGRIHNVGRTFRDGSLRLVRDVPYGTAAWKLRYRRGRNAAEQRNAVLEGWRLKRLPVFGHPRAQATLFLADLWRNLLTLARLVHEATLAQLTPATATG